MKMDMSTFAKLVAFVMWVSAIVGPVFLIIVATAK
jgi:hypothetical protein